MSNNNKPWRSIVVLNAVSTFSQLGQFGVGFIVLPIWLASRGEPAINLGQFGAAEWIGMLIGLFITPKLLTKLTSKAVVLIGLLTSSLALGLMPDLNWPLWAVPALLIGFGTGLRWISNETWLYRITPQHIVGQIVGAHEAFIALAVIVAPILVLVFGTINNKVIVCGILFNVIAAIPLFFIKSEPLQKSKDENHSKWDFFKLVGVTRLGVIISGVGGIIDGALMALFPIFGLGRGFVEAEIAVLLTIMGIGNLLMQYPLGWLSDRIGFINSSLFVAILSCLTASAMAFIPMSFGTLSMLSFVFGGVTSAFLTLGIIAAASEKNPIYMAENMSKVSMTFTASSIAGALLAGASTQKIGSDTLIWLVIASSMLLSIVFFQAKSKH